ncbi:MAG TPA: hypothetical protein VEW94_11940 [Chloroflexia bacterium]|nr:hypothetical protein [Chloroflexia bacterium]
MNGYLIYHPARAVSRLGDLTIYHDATTGNQDPYIWNKCFLHTYCHITGLRAAAGDINFWVSGDHFPRFNHLYCDLVFVVAEKLYWSARNAIVATDSLVDTPAAYADHYRWASIQHRFKRRRRYTLKADPLRSFQPQDGANRLIDLVPFLVAHGFSLEMLRQGLRRGFRSRPMVLGAMASDLYIWLAQTAPVKINGSLLQEIRQQHPELASPDP